MCGGQEGVRTEDERIFNKTAVTGGCSPSQGAAHDRVLCPVSWGCWEVTQQRWSLLSPLWRLQVRNPGAGRVGSSVPPPSRWWLLALLGPRSLCLHLPLSIRTPLAALGPP